MGPRWVGAWLCLTVMVAMSTGGCAKPNESDEAQWLYGDQGDNVTRMALQAFVRSLDRDRPLEVLIRAYGYRTDNLTVSYAADVRVVVDKLSGDSSKDERTGGAVMAVRPENFPHDDFGGLYAPLVLDDSLFPTTSWYRASADATMHKNGRIFSSMVFLHVDQD